jgi:solute carrier family 26 (sodium-independent sulfate anion transporter), member 11
MSSQKTGNILAKSLGIHTEKYREPEESTRVVPDAYVEAEPTVQEFLREHAPTVDGIKGYLKELFPFWGWIFHYNLTWLFGDLIAG